MPLRRNQKIGIAAAGGAAAIGLTAALIYAARRTPKCDSGSTYSEVTGKCEPIVLVGYPGDDGTGDPLTQAKRRFCSYPNGLSLEQLGLLEQSVFAPIVLGSDYLNWGTPQQIDDRLADVANAAIDQLCRGVTRQRTRQIALQLARSAWWSVTGQTGQ